MDPDLSRPSARIVGGGLAGAGAARTLNTFGWHVRLASAAPRPHQPIALNGASQFLIERLWGKQVLEGATLHRLQRRVMVWRDSGRPEVMQDEAIVVDGAALAATLLGRIPDETGPDRAADWVFTAGGRLLAPEQRLSAGTRTATAIEVELAPAADPQAFLVEATAGGWLALMPTGGRRATLFAFAPQSRSRLAELVGGARVVRRALAARAAESSTFDAMPTFALPAEDGARALAIGSAAMTFDPLSGDGVAASLRGAHLAASLAQAHRQGANLEGVRRSYASRLARAMRVHLQGLEALYSQAPFAAAWAGEIEAIAGMARALEPLAEDESAPAFAVSERGATVHPAP